LEGDSTLHRFKADATQFRASFTIDDTGGDAELSELVSAHRVTGFVLEIPVDRLRSGDGSLDEKMVKALKSRAHPLIVFRTESYQFVPESGEASMRLRGRLLIAGVENSIEIGAKATRAGSGLRVTGRKQLQMSDYGIQPPVLMFGALKVKDAVTVSFDLELQPD
jgi:hypothetical protein